jgi:lipopolysaccharide export system protein LptA
MCCNYQANHPFFATLLLATSLCLSLTILPGMAQAAKHAPAADTASTSSSSASGSTGSGDAPKQVEVTADKSLEWYQDQHIYVARGNAKAVRGDMVVEADLLTAHEREKPTGPDGKKLPGAKTASNSNGTGDIDKMTAEGNVRITDPKQRVTGDHGVYDLDQHVMVMTGNNLRYETEKEIVTARDSLEYWEDKKIAVARGHAVGIQGDRHVEGDMLTAEFRDGPNNSSQLWKLTAVGNVTVVSKGSVAKGDRTVYDVASDIAILTGNVRITRADGTQLTGDVGEVNFKTNQSRLMNDGTGRVRALLTSKSTSKVGPKTASSATAGSAGIVP